MESQLDLAFSTRPQRRRQQEAERAQSERAIADAHAKLANMQERFCSEVRALIDQAVSRANRHLAKRPEKWQLVPISGYFTGPLYVGGAACNPIAYEILSDGHEVGETLIVEWTHEGLVEAFLGPFRPLALEGQSARLELGWDAMPLAEFDADSAADLVVRYITAITAL